MKNENPLAEISAALGLPEAATIKEVVKRAADLVAAEARDQARQAHEARINHLQNVAGMSRRAAAECIAMQDAEAKRIAEEQKAQAKEKERK